jgi:hypothetical protein
MTPLRAKHVTLVWFVVFGHEYAGFTVCCPQGWMAGGLRSNLPSGKRSAAGIRRKGSSLSGAAFFCEADK